jgi:hypothetical protein
MTMTSRERVLAALEHREPDAVPVGEAGIDHDLVEEALGREVHWRSKARTIRMLWEGRRDELVAGFKRDLEDLVAFFGYDLVPVFLVPPAGSRPEAVRQVGADEWEDERGCRWRYSPGNDSYLLMSRPRRSFASAAQLEEFFEDELAGRFGFRITGRDGAGYRLRLDDQSRLELVRHAVARFGGEKFIFAREFSYNNGSTEPMELSEFEVVQEFFGGGEADLFLAIAEEPELVRRAIELYAEVHLATTDVLAAEGVDAVLSGGDFSSEQGPMIDPEAVRGIFLPAMKREVERAHARGLKAITHNCGNNWRLLDMLMEAGYDCLQSIQRSATMDIGKLKARCGRRLALWGGIEISSLHAPDPERARADVLDALRKGARGGGLVLGACSTVAYGCSCRNYLAALESARRCGRYPIREEPAG